MISISSSTACILYLAFSLMSLCAIWISQSRRYAPHQLEPDRIVSQCEYCQGQYLAGRWDNVSQCPKCTSYNHHRNEP